MNCLMGISLTLIAIVAGMLLLAKTQKDNLGTIYKVISYFVIITAFFSFLAGIGCGLVSMVHCVKGAGGCSPIGKSQMMQGGCMGGGGGSCMMMNPGGMHGMSGMGCEMKGMRCEKKGMCCEMKGMNKSCKKKCKMMGMGEDEEMEDINVEILHKKVEKEEKVAEPAKK